MASNASFPIATRQASTVIAGFPTEILLQFFNDKTVIFVNQGKIGRMLQITPPTSNRRRAGERRDPFNDIDEEEEQEQDQQQESNGTHTSLEDTFLPAPDASSTITTLFGTSKNDETRQLEQLYASQIAAILFAKAKRPQTEQNEEEGLLLKEAKPVVVALGFKAAFLEGNSGGGSEDTNEDMHQQRSRFKEVMELVNGVI